MIVIATYAKNALPFVVIGALMAFVVRVVADKLDGMWGMTPVGLALEILVGGAVFALGALAWVLASKDGNFRAILGKGDSS